jgi:mannitol 2-dehydrogenase
MQNLTNEALGNLPAKIKNINYNRADITAGIVHIGVGNFHRAHQALYLNELFNLGLDLNWGIIGAGLMPGDAIMRDKMLAQNCLYSVVELHSDKYQAEICGSIIDFAPTTSAALYNLMCRAEIKIISLTVTEGGYYIEPKSGGFNDQHPDILAEKQHIKQPTTVFGNIVKALKFRKEHGLSAVTILSCDNLPHNGLVTKNAVLGLAKIIAPELVDWINQNISFPNSMVDRITPATSQKELDFYSKNFTLNDQAVVMCEPYKQWVIEDKFAAGRPDFAKVGVEFVTDVAHYELMKLRILNASHAALSYPAFLLGYEYVHEAMQDRLIVKYLERLITEEAIPTIPVIKNLDFAAYFNKVIERFSNPKMVDTIERLTMDGSNRQPKFIFATLLDRLKAGASIKGLAIEIALWCRFCAVTSLNGKKVKLHDVNEVQLREKALAAKEQPEQFLQMTDIFGNLGEYQEFKQEFKYALEQIWQKGVAEALQQYINKA